MRFLLQNLPIVLSSLFASEKKNEAYHSSVAELFDGVKADQAAHAVETWQVCLTILLDFLSADYASTRIKQDRNDDEQGKSNNKCSLADDAVTISVRAINTSSLARLTLLLTRSLFSRLGGTIAASFTC